MLRKISIILILAASSSIAVGAEDNRAGASKRPHEEATIGEIMRRLRARPEAETTEQATESSSAAAPVDHLHLSVRLKSQLARVRQAFLAVRAHGSKENIAQFSLQKNIFDQLFVQIRPEIVMLDQAQAVYRRVEVLERTVQLYAKVRNVFSSLLGIELQGEVTTQNVAIIENELNALKADVAGGYAEGSPDYIQLMSALNNATTRRLGWLQGLAMIADNMAPEEEISQFFEPDGSNVAGI